MSKLQEFRASYPQYEDISDEQLLSSLHRRFYSDIPFDDFSARMTGGATQQRRGPEQEPVPERSLLGTVGARAGDVLGSVVSGAGSVATGIGGLAGVTGAVSQDNMLTRLGRGVSELGSGLMSPELRNQRRVLSAAVQEAEERGLGAEAAAALQTLATNPGLLASMAIEQIPAFILSGGVGRAASLAGQAATRGGVRAGTMAAERATEVASRAGQAGAVGTAAGLQAGSVSTETYQEVMNLSIETLQRSPVYQDLLRTMSPEDARAAVADRAAREAGLLGGGISVGTMALLPSAEAAMFSRGVSRRAIARALGVGAGEATSEGIEEGGGQFAQNLAIQRQADAERSLTRGVGGAAATGAVLGGVAGSAIGALQRPPEVRTDERPELRRAIEEYVAGREPLPEETRLLPREPRIDTPVGDLSRYQLLSYMERSLPRIIQDNPDLASRMEYARNEDERLDVFREYLKERQEDLAAIRQQDEVSRIPPRPDEQPDLLNRPPQPEPTKAPAGPLLNIPPPVRPVTQTNAETPTPQAETFNIPVGRQFTVATPDGSMNVDVVPEVVDLFSLTPASGGLQNRMIDNPANQATINNIANAPDFARLGTSPYSDRGAPIIGPDNVIEIGNHRVEGLKRAAENNPEAFKSYVSALNGAGYDTTGMQFPVLIRRRVSELTPEQRQDFTRLSNSEANQVLSDLELARQDASLLTPELLAKFDGEVSGGVRAAKNLPFVRDFLTQATTPSERTRLISPEGGISDALAARLEMALFASAYNDISLIKRAVETGDDDTKSITGGMIEATGAMQELRRGIDEGRIRPEFDIVPALVKAADRIRAGKANGLTPGDIIATEDMLNPIPPVEREAIRLFSNDSLTKIASKSAIGKRLKAYVEEAKTQSPVTDLVGGERRITPEEALVIARNPGQASMFSARRVGEKEAEAAPQPEEDQAPNVDRARKIITKFFDELRAEGRQGRLIAKDLADLIRDRKMNANQIYQAFIAAKVISKTLPSKGDFRLRFLQDIVVDNEQAGRASGATVGQRAQGRVIYPTDSLPGFIELSLAPDMLPFLRETAAHEAFHVLQSYFSAYDKNFSDRVDRFFKDGMKVSDLEPSIKKRLMSLKAPDQNVSYYQVLEDSLGDSPLSAKEAQAYAFGALIDAANRGQKVTGLIPSFQRFFVAARAFFSGMKRALRGDGFESPSDILTAAQRRGRAMEQAAPIQRGAQAYSAREVGQDELPPGYTLRDVTQRSTTRLPDGTEVDSSRPEFAVIGQYGMSVASGSTPQEAIQNFKESEARRERERLPPEDTRRAFPVSETARRGPEVSGFFRSVSDIERAVKNGELVSQRERESKCYGYSGNAAIETGNEYVIGTVSDGNGRRIPHAVMRDSGGRIYDPQFDAWFDSNAYSDAVGGFDTTVIMTGQEVAAFGRDTGKYPSPTTIAAAERQKKSESYSARRVTDRDPVLEEAARGVREGTVSREQYEQLVNERKPVTPYSEVPEPATLSEITNALDSDKVPKIGVPSKTLKEGDLVGLRLDIPAYSKHNTWVVSVHEAKGKSFYAGTVIGYEPTAVATDVQLGVVSGGAMKIAAGDIPKTTIAVMRGKWKPTTPEQAKARADEVLNNPDWVQVGMDPRRHQYFYDRTTKEPIVAADEVIQVGPLVLAKNPTYASKSDYQYSARRVPTSETITVGGVERSTRDSDGRAIHPTEDGIRNFWRWFGGSVVADEDGNPVMVYHGTSRDKDFDKFKVGQRGAWFTTNPKEASDYAEENDSGYKVVDYSPRTGYVKKDISARVIPVYLSIKNPAVLTDEQKNKLQYAKNYAKAQSEVFNDLRAAGYDGVNMGGGVWVAFNPTQIKSAIGNRGTFSETDQRIQYSARRVPEYAARTTATATPKDFFQQVKTQINEPSVFDKALSVLLDKKRGETIGQAFARTSINRAASLYNLDQIAKEGGYTGRSAAKAMELALQNTGRMAQLLTSGMGKINPKTGGISLRKDVKPLFEIMKGANLKTERLKDEFQVYLAALRERDLRTRGRKGFFDATPAQISDWITRSEAAHPEWVKAAAELDKLNNALVDWALDTGLVDAAQSKTLRDVFYTPFYRLMDKDSIDDPTRSISPKIGESFTNVASAINREMKGGTKPLGDLYENIIRNADSIMKAGLKNLAMREAAKTMEFAKLGRKVSTKDPNSTIVYKVDGKDVIFEVDDAALFAALAGMPRHMQNGIYNTMAKMAAIFRDFITVAPSFMFTNLWRGKISAYVQEGQPFMTNTFAGLMDALKASSSLQNFQLQTGFGGMEYGMGERDMAAAFERKLTDEGVGAALKKGKVLSAIRQGFNKMQEISEATEMAERIKLAENLMKGGMSKEDAEFQAYLLAPYSRRGTGQGWVGSTLQWLMPLVPFLNAKLQTTYRLFENEKGDKRRLWTLGIPQQIFLRGLVVTGFSLLAYLANLADDEKKWDDIPSYMKLNYDMIPLGDGYITLPRAFEIGQFFGALPIFILDAVRRGESRDLAAALAEVGLNTFWMNPTPQAIKPIFSIWTNYDFFRGRPLETMSDQNLPVEERANRSTTTAGRVLAGTVNAVAGSGVLSPIRAQALLDGYTGTLGTSLMAAFDSALAGVGAIPGKPAGAFGNFDLPANLLGANRFYREGERTFSRFVGDFYKIKEITDQLVRSQNLARETRNFERLEELRGEAGAPLRIRQIVNRASEQISELNRRIARIERSDDLDGVAKAQSIEPLVQRRNEIARGVVERARAAGAF